MADIDMIPRSYRETLRVRRTLAAYGTALAVLLALGTGAGVLLRWRLAVETPRLEQMRKDAALAAALRTQLAGTQQKKDGLANDVDALAGLRGSGDGAVLAQVLEATLNDRVWIEQLHFTRTEEALREAPPSPLPPGTVRLGTGQAWRLGSHVELSGRALDQRAMTEFLAALSAHPSLANVRFLNSSDAAAEDGNVVAFSAAATLVKRKEAP